MYLFNFRTLLIWSCFFSHTLSVKSVHMYIICKSRGMFVCFGVFHYPLSYSSYQEIWTILKSIHEGGDIGSWNQKRDWEQYWPRVILNELGRWRSWDLLHSILILNYSPSSCQILINRNFFLWPNKWYLWKCMVIIEIQETKWNTAVLEHMTHIFLLASMFTRLLAHKDIVQRIVLRWPCVVDRMLESSY